MGVTKCCKHAKAQRIRLAVHDGLDEPLELGDAGPVGLVDDLKARLPVGGHLVVSGFLGGDHPRSRELERAFVQGGISAARFRTWPEQRRFFAGLEMVEPGLSLFSATRHLERIADHATNIAEDVIYLVEGTLVRHRPAAVREED